MSCNEVSDFVKQARQNLAKQDTSLDILSVKSPIDRVTKSIHDAMSSTGAEKLFQSPLSALGKDFLAEQISKNGQQLIDNATGALKKEVNKIANFDVRKTIEDAQKQIYNTIAAALTAQNDLSIIFLQRVAQNAITAIDEKRAILLVLKEKVTKLHNALKILVAGAPFFNAYIEKLRAALIKIQGAKTKVDSVKSTYVATKRFLPARFDQAKKDLEDAAVLMTPGPQTVSQVFSNFGTSLLQNIGLPSSSEQLTALLAVPQLAQECAFAATGYFIATLKVNALLLAFSQGYDKFTKASSKLLDNYSISLLQSTSDKIAHLIERMSTELNGNSLALRPTDYAKSPIAGSVQEVSPEFISIRSGTNVQQVPLKKTSLPRVAPGDQVPFGRQVAEYRPDSIKVSLQALSWIIELRAVVDYMSLVPGSTLGNVAVSNSALDKYRAAVEAIAKKDSRTRGDAILTATDGREDLSQLQSQLNTYVLGAVRAITNPVVAGQITALGRTVLARLDLSLEQDAEIKAILQPFITAQVGLRSTLPGIAGAIKSALKNSGMDRAADLLDGGAFDEFFNLNSKTATYAGAALVGIATLKKCLSTTEDREQLTQAERVIQREVKAKELLVQRTAVSGFQQQKATNAKQDQALSTVEVKAQEACAKCGLPEDFNVGSLLKGVSSSLGLASLGSVTLPGSLSNIGKGFL